MGILNRTERFEVEAWANGTLSERNIDRMTLLVNQWEEEHASLVASADARVDHADEIEAAWWSLYEHVKNFQ